MPSRWLSAKRASSGIAWRLVLVLGGACDGTLTVNGKVLTAPGPTQSHIYVHQSAPETTGVSPLEGAIVTINVGWNVGSCGHDREGPHLMRQSLGATNASMIMKNWGNNLTTALILAALPPIAGCAEPSCVALVRASPLLAEAYPMGLGKPNTVIETLPVGEYQYADVHFGKDWMVYEVERPGGAHGYLVSSEGTATCDPR